MTGFGWQIEKIGNRSDSLKFSINWPMSSYGRNSQLFYLMCNNKCVNDVQSATKVHISYHFLCFWTDFKCHKLKDAKCLSLFDEACLWGHYGSSAELFELSVDAAPHSSVASPICQEGQIERSFPIFAFSSWFFSRFLLIFPDFWQFFLCQGWHSAPRGVPNLGARSEPGFCHSYSHRCHQCISRRAV